MSSQIDSREIFINMMCIEKGIVPFLGVNTNHVSETLFNMNEHDRRVAVRKFRKILKKAIRHEAATWHSTDSCQYIDRIKKLRLNAGLGDNPMGSSSKKLSIRARTLRRTLVARYLADASTKLNN